MTLNLTEGQKDVLRLAESGHNICLFGKAGVGKTTVVIEMIKKISTEGKQCFVVRVECLVKLTRRSNNHTFLIWTSSLRIACYTTGRESVEK